MKIAIRYYTQTGNTKKLAEAIADELGLKPENLSVPLEEETDILFLCNSVYWAGIAKQVKQFVKDNAAKIGQLVNVSSAALIESTYNQMKTVAKEAGVKISDQEFHCRGNLALLHAGHPDEADLKEARTFARKIVG